ncbi:hypothetical protein NQ176_g11232 [Zarea fungicola]|uniref:Uncharacterized protein n=1 Tax=Zarea fungicola TaxID=93591 RepID=A0ACC1MC05_9HYPO|nr:hypothetical protein NQ176_g11232 [Lecanicillium fungicola]
MGRQTRSQLENLLRSGVLWNPYAVYMHKMQKEKVVTELCKIGFRNSHVVEAVEYCKDREETLEWLLIHVPEDDLPRWALPEKYAAGVTIGTNDLRRDGALQRLSQNGYSLELCARVYDQTGGDEGKTAEALQKLLFSRPNIGDEDVQDETLDFLDMGSPQEQWREETESLEAMYGAFFSRDGDDTITIQLESVKNPPHKVEASLQVRRGSNYPNTLIIGIIAKLPSYIKLSIVRKALEYIDSSLKDEPMKVFLVLDWIQQNVNDIIEHPGRLVDISAVSSAASEQLPGDAIKSRKRQKPPARSIRWSPDPRSKVAWDQRQESSAWKEMLGKRQRLPAWSMRQRIVKTVADNHVTIISGETGSGKSTQSVQFILDDLYGKGLGDCANMLVTQPRRISALGLADRVAEERCGRVGQEVGYIIRGESQQSKDTRITFMTTGILLRRLQTSGGRVEDVVASLADVSHVIVDEVHERSLDTDFLLNLIREVLRMKKDALKLILMSATLDAASFINYFASEGLKVGAVEIEGRTFPVTEYYLDDVIRMTGYNADIPDGGFIGDDQMGKIIQKLGHRINYNLIVEAVKAIDYELSYDKQPGGILIFLPGVGEISQTCHVLRSISSLHVLPLHASLETREQKRVFARSPPAAR